MLFVATLQAAQLSQAILDWWQDAQNLTAGWNYDYNVFDSTPDFVDMAQKGLRSDQVTEAAQDILSCWKRVEYMTMGPHGERNVFDSEPDLVGMAKQLLAE